LSYGRISYQFVLAQKIVEPTPHFVLFMAKSAVAWLSLTHALAEAKATDAFLFLNRESKTAEHQCK